MRAATIAKPKPSEVVTVSKSRCFFQAAAVASADGSKIRTNTKRGTTTASPTQKAAVPRPQSAEMKSRTSLSWTLSLSRAGLNDDRWQDVGVEASALAAGSAVHRLKMW